MAAVAMELAVHSAIELAVKPAMEASVKTKVVDVKVDSAKENERLIRANFVVAVARSEVDRAIVVRFDDHVSHHATAGKDCASEYE